MSKEFKPSEIKCLCIPSFGFEEMVSSASEGVNVAEWNDDYSIHAPFIKKSYEYYESGDVILKKRERLCCFN